MKTKTNTQKSLHISTALTHANKDKADIALDDAETTAQLAKKTQYGKIWPHHINVVVYSMYKYVYSKHFDHFCLQCEQLKSNQPQ